MIKPPPAKAGGGFIIEITLRARQAAHFRTDVRENGKQRINNQQKGIFGAV